MCTQRSFRLNDVLAFVASTGNNSIYLAIADNCVDGFRPKGSPANYTNYRQVTRATHVRNRICPPVELILKIIIILLIIFLGFIKNKPC